jgi:hypothetical protein
MTLMACSQYSGRPGLGQENVDLGLQRFAVARQFRRGIDHARRRDPVSRAASLTPEMFSETAPVPRAASAMSRAISSVAAPCCSTAEAIALAISLTLLDDIADFLRRKRQALTSELALFGLTDGGAGELLTGRIAGPGQGVPLGHKVSIGVTDAPSTAASNRGFQIDIEGRDERQRLRYRGGL